MGLALLGRILAGIPAVVEWHRTEFFPRVAPLLQWASGGAKGTVGEVVALCLIVSAIAFALARRTRALGGLAFGGGLLVLAFYLSWGLAYGYPPLAGRLADAPDLDEEASRPRLAGLAGSSARLVARASEGALSFGGSDAAFLARVNAGLDEGFTRWPAALEAAPVRGIVFGPAKPSRVSFALSRLLISGFYFPWSGEAQINAEMPRTLWPRVSGHEKAHQRGFARENEATLIGMITCLSSHDPTVFYGGALGLFVGLDRELARVDKEARRRIWAELPPRVVSHLEAEAAFWKKHEGAAGKVSERVNDTYLKAQGVKSGIGSYAETTRLILQAVATPGLNLGRLLQAESARAEVPRTPVQPVR
ncbi:MAG: DUF3810 domain-containing protein [Vicinamibacteria bacterium]|nr:DUF3810 domain-containing protein [Vicinamibacteria bacterium]